MRRVPYGVVILLLLSFSALGDERAALESFLAAHAPTHGTIEAAFAPQDGSDEQHVGIDFKSGAWFRVMSVSASGRDSDGVCYFGDAGLGRTKIFGHCEREELALIDFVPSVSLWMMRRYPEIIKQVDRWDEGLVATIEVAPAESGATTTLTVFLTNAGRVHHFQPASRPSLAPGGIQYRDDSPPGIPLPVEVGTTGLSLVGFSVEPVRGQFTRDRVESLAAQCKQNAAKALAAKSSSTPREGSVGATSGVPVAPPPGTEWKVPLIVAGVIILGLGLAISWKRRLA